MKEILQIIRWEINKLINIRQFNVNLNSIHTSIIIVPKTKKEAVLYNRGLFVMYIGDLFTTGFSPKGPSSRNTNIKITRKLYWVTSGL
jgi:hypothetical protein